MIEGGERVKGSETAFAEFASANIGRLTQFAELLTGDPHRAADLVQEALERAYLRWHKVDLDDPYAYVRFAGPDLPTRVKLSAAGATAAHDPSQSPGYPAPDYLTHETIITAPGMAPGWVFWLPASVPHLDDAVDVTLYDAAGKVIRAIPNASTTPTTTPAAAQTGTPTI